MYQDRGKGSLVLIRTFNITFTQVVRVLQSHYAPHTYICTSSAFYRGSIFPFSFFLALQEIYFARDSHWSVRAVYRTDTFRTDTFKTWALPLTYVQQVHILKVQYVNHILTETEPPNTCVHTVQYVKSVSLSQFTRLFFISTSFDGYCSTFLLQKEE